MPTIEKIPHGRLDPICRSLAETVTHRTSTELMERAGIQEWGGSPKWERLLLALEHRQQREGCANALALKQARFDSC